MGGNGYEKACGSHCGICNGGSIGVLQTGSLTREYADAILFAGEIISVEEDYLLIEVNDSGNSNLSDGCTVEVSTKVTGADDCPDFSKGHY